MIYETWNKKHNLWIDDKIERNIISVRKKLKDAIDLKRNYTLRHGCHLLAPGWNGLWTRSDFCMPLAETALGHVWFHACHLAETAHGYGMVGLLPATFPKLLLGTVFFLLVPWPTRLVGTMARVRISTLGWSFLASKVPTDTPHLNSWWINLAKILICFVTWVKIKR